MKRILILLMSLIILFGMSGCDTKTSSQFVSKSKSEKNADKDTNKLKEEEKAHKFLEKYIECLCSHNFEWLYKHYAIDVCIESIDDVTMKSNIRQSTINATNQNKDIKIVEFITNDDYYAYGAITGATQKSDNKYRESIMWAVKIDKEFKVISDEEIEWSLVQHWDGSYDETDDESDDEIDDGTDDDGLTLDTYQSNSTELNKQAIQQQEEIQRQQEEMQRQHEEMQRQQEEMQRQMQDQFSNFGNGF